MQFQPIFGPEILTSYLVKCGNKMLYFRPCWLHMCARGPSCCRYPCVVQAVVQVILLPIPLTSVACLHSKSTLDCDFTLFSNKLNQSLTNPDFITMSKIFKPGLIIRLCLLSPVLYICIYIYIYIYV